MKHLFVLICIFSLSFTLSAQKIGLVLSGGGAKGLAHIGLIKVLEENNIPIDYIAGTSMGAIVAAMYASGMSADEMVAIVTGSDFQNWALGNVSEEYKYQFLKREEDASWLDLNFNLDSGFKPQIPTGMIPTHSMDFAFMEYFAPPSAAAGYDFDSLFVPFRCVASDVNLREAVIFSEGDLGSAVRASMAAPFYFSPVVIKGKLLFDGGIYNNFPVDVLIKDFNPDYIIGCNVSHNSTPASEENPLLQLENMIVAPTDYSVPPEKGVLIEPDIQGIKFADFSKAWEIIDRGYQESLNNIDEIKANVHRCVSVE
ncbi:MAG: patatin, partial [Bacteroidetes bacterium HGW-Bacteroidetes-21]